MKPRLSAEASLYKTSGHYHAVWVSDQNAWTVSQQQVTSQVKPCATRCAGTCRTRCGQDTTCFDECFRECIDIHCCDAACESCVLLGGQCQKHCIDDDCNHYTVPCSC